MVSLWVSFCLFPGRNVCSLVLVKYPAELNAQNRESQPITEDCLLSWRCTQSHSCQTYIKISRMLIKCVSLTNCTNRLKNRLYKCLSFNLLWCWNLQCTQFNKDHYYKYLENGRGFGLHQLCDPWNYWSYMAEVMGVVNALLLIRHIMAQS